MKAIEWERDGKGWSCPTFLTVTISVRKKGSVLKYKGFLKPPPQREGILTHHVVFEDSLYNWSEDFYDHHGPRAFPAVLQEETMNPFDGQTSDRLP